MAIKKPLLLTISLLWGVAIFLLILVAGNKALLSTLAVYIGITMMGIVAFRSPNTKFTNNLIGLHKKSLGRSIVIAIILGLAFWLITKFIPGFSIGTIRLPQTIGSTFRTIVIIGFAPIVETIFQVIIFAWMRTFTSTRNAVLGQATIFSLSHLSAYISGFYNFPTFVQGLDALTANIASFAAAFIFAWIGFTVMLRPKIKNIGFLIVLHAILNAIILLALSIVFI